MRFPDITGYRLSEPIQLALTQGAYTTRSLVAEAQRCVNLYPEQNPQDAPFPTTHYPTPGLSVWSAAPTNNGTLSGRGLYRSTRGQLFAVVGPTLYNVLSTGLWQPIGNLATLAGPVNFIDNGLTVLVVDGPSSVQLAMSPSSTVQTVPQMPALSPGPLSWYMDGNTLQSTNIIEFGVNIEAGSTSTVVNVLLDPDAASSAPFPSGNGYAIQFNAEAGQQCGQLFRLTNSVFTAIGTFTQPPNTAALAVGLHTVSCIITGNNSFQLWVDGILQSTAQDATYSNFNATFYGSPTETTVAQIGPSGVISPGVYLVDITTLEFSRITNPAIYGATHCDYVDTFFVLNQPDSQAFYISNSNLAYIDATEGPITGTTLTAGGTNYANGTFSNVPLTGGLGTGAQATIVVAGGIVTSATLTQAGNGYAVGDVLSAALNSTAGLGPVTGLKLASGGSQMVSGTYPNLGLTGGTGTGAQATLTVSLNFVQSFALTAAGTGYTQGDQLTAPVPLMAYKPRPEPAYYADPVFLAQVTPTATGSGLQITVTSISLQNAVNALNIANKTGFADLLVGLIIVHREIWLFGRQTIEVWVDTGAADFPFGLEGGIFIQRGLLAPYSLCKSDLTPLWLGEDQNGRAMAFMGVQYNAQRISTHAMENEWQTYARVDDAVGFTYQQGGHTFWVLNFPTADRTWVFDIAIGLWHQRGTVDQDGTIHRYLGQSYVNCFGLDLVQRWDTGDLLQMDPEIYDELGEPVTRIRSFPHIKREMRRMVYPHFVVDMQTGASASSNTLTAYPRTVNLRWSDDGAQTWSATLPMPMPVGLTNQLMRWNRLGIARDRVFEISWRTSAQTAMNGAWLAYIMCDS